MSCSLDSVFKIPPQHATGNKITNLMADVLDRVNMTKRELKTVDYEDSHNMANAKFKARAEKQKKVSMTLFGPFKCKIRPRVDDTYGEQE
jgi:nucleoid DNA-binding protein